jgi:HB1, ASXL, restriction endonuclease HTH domain
VLLRNVLLYHGLHPKSQEKLRKIAGDLEKAPRTEPKTSKTSRGLQKPKGEKKMSCLDAAAKLLTETGQPMSCQQLIEAIAAKGYWTSPPGKTPRARPLSTGPK